MRPIDAGQSANDRQNIIQYAACRLLNGLLNGLINFLFGFMGLSKLWQTRFREFIVNLL